MATAIAPVEMVSYSAAAFNGLPDFDDSKSRFFDRKHVLDLFGAVIRKHHAEKFLGAALIHKHFDLNPGERIIEDITTEGSLLSPRMLNTDITPYLWYLNCDASGRRLWTPVEFVLSSDVPGSVRDFANGIEKMASLLANLATVLVDNDAQDTLGLALLHRQLIQFDRDTQVLLESPGPAERTLKVTPVHPSVTSGADWTQTYWHFDVNNRGVVNGCSQHGCAGYCSLHQGGGDPS